MTSDNGALGAVDVIAVAEPEPIKEAGVKQLAEAPASKLHWYKTCVWTLKRLAKTEKTNSRGN